MSDRRTHPLRWALPVVLIALVCLWGCTQQPPQTVTTSSAPPPAPSLPAHGPGQVALSSCGPSTSHGANYKAIACPEVCRAAVTNHTVALDDYIDNPTRDNDPDVCMHFGANDTLTYTTRGGNGRTIQIMRYENNGNEGHPFRDAEAPPYPHGGPGNSAAVGHLDPGRRPPAGRCFVFEGYILVKENGKADRCFDPHIYTE